MSFLDFLKTKQEKEAAKKEKKPVKAVLKPEKPAEIPVKSAGLNAAASKILRRPRITEKAGLVGEQNKYVFDVYGGANKPEVKKSIEAIYGKKVEKVNIVNVPPKKKRRGRTEYFKSGIKKAIVTLKEGETIEVMPR